MRDEQPIQTEETETDIADGGYTEPRTPDDHAKIVFERAVALGPIGVEYEVFEVATQVVAGMNYRFGCYARSIAPKADEYKVYMYVFEALPCYGGKVEITQIEVI